VPDRERGWRLEKWGVDVLCLDGNRQIIVEVFPPSHRRAMGFLDRHDIVLEDREEGCRGPLTRGFEAGIEGVSQVASGGVRQPDPRRGFPVPEVGSQEVRQAAVLEVLHDGGLVRHRLLHPVVRSRQFGRLGVGLFQADAVEMVPVHEEWPVELDDLPEVPLVAAAIGERDPVAPPEPGPLGFHGAHGFFRQRFSSSRRFARVAFRGSWILTSSEKSIPKRPKSAPMLPG
jgi:hypothetical protein